MRGCANVLLLSLVMVAGAAVAQSASHSGKSGESRSIEECWRGTDRQRMQWEASQTYFYPAMPNRDQLPKMKPIYIESQAPANLPKLRREWLQPSSEIFAGDSATETVPTPGDQSRGFLVPKQERVKQ